MRADGESFWTPENPETLSDSLPLTSLGFPLVVFLLVALDLLLAGIDVVAEISCALSLVSNLTSGFLPIDVEEIDFGGLDTSEVHSQLTSVAWFGRAFILFSNELAVNVRPNRERQGDRFHAFGKSSNYKDQLWQGQVTHKSTGDIWSIVAPHPHGSVLMRFQGCHDFVVEQDSLQVEIVFEVDCCHANIVNNSHGISCKIFHFCVNVYGGRSFTLNNFVGAYRISELNCNFLGKINVCR